MEYINRELERKFLKMNKVFKALLVTGARQVGISRPTIASTLSGYFCAYKTASRPDIE